MRAAGLDCDCGSGSGSKCDCLFSVQPGEKPSPSTPLEAQAGFCAELPSGHWRPGSAGGSGKQRLHPPGPEGAVRQPPRASGVYGSSPAMMSAILGGWWMLEPEAWGRRKLKPTFGVWMVLWLVEKGSSSCQVPVKKDPDMFILVRVCFCLSARHCGQIKSVGEILQM